MLVKQSNRQIQKSKQFYAGAVNSSSNVLQTATISIILLLLYVFALYHTHVFNEALETLEIVFIRDELIVQS